MMIIIEVTIIRIVVEDMVKVLKNLEKKTGWKEDLPKNQDHPNHSIVKIG